MNNNQKPTRALAWDDKPSEFMDEFAEILKTKYNTELDVVTDPAEFDTRFRNEGPWSFVVLDVVEERDGGDTTDPFAGITLATDCRKLAPTMPIFMVTANTSIVLRQAKTVEPPTYYMAKEFGPPWVAMDINQVLSGFLYSRKSSNSNLSKPIVVIFSALDEELDYLKENAELDWSDLQDDCSGFTYRRCELQERVLIAASAPKMGLSHAAATAASLFSCWQPELAFMIGVCAGRKEKKIGLGDIVVAELAYHFQYGSYQNGEISGQLAVENTDPSLLALARDFLGVERNLSAIREEFGKRGNRPENALQGFVGPMACSDLVVLDKAKFEEAAEADRKVIALEMESYAFLLSARLCGVKKALVVKSAMDFADAKKNDDYREYAKFTSTNAMLGILKNLGDK